MKVNDFRVGRLIVEALISNDRNMQLAFDQLYKMRNAPGADTTDVDLAAAEYYLLCRKWVGLAEYSATQAKMQVFAYDGIKMLVPKRLEPLLRHDPERPTSPRSEGVKNWALAGIVAGENDRTRTETPSPGWQVPPTFNKHTEKILSTLQSYRPSK